MRARCKAQISLSRPNNIVNIYFEKFFNSVQAYNIYEIANVNKHIYGIL